jgi:hypothetical protein
MEDPEQLMARFRAMPDTELHDVAEAVRQVQIERAIAAGDLNAVIANAFEIGFGRDGLGADPWIEGNLVVCPGAIVTKSRTNHRCRFVSVDDVWVWDSGLLVREDKRSTLGGGDGRTPTGFRAVALVALVDGTTLDVVSGRARAVVHEVDHVTSIEVRAGTLVEVGQRNVKAANMR